MILKPVLAIPLNASGSPEYAIAMYMLTGQQSNEFEISVEMQLVTAESTCDACPLSETSDIWICLACAESTCLVT
jgi:hypothetical protein